MSVLLSDEQRQAVNAAPGGPVEVIDEFSQAKYVLLPAEQFEHLKALLAAEKFAVAETYEAQSQALGRAGWDDPGLDIYNDYDSHRQ